LWTRDAFVARLALLDNDWVNFLASVVGSEIAGDRVLGDWVLTV